MTRQCQPAAGHGTPQRQSDEQCVEGPRRIPAETLFAGEHEVIIEHGGEHYRLRRTSRGKLILTK